MKKMWICVGPSNSGKTAWAESKCKTDSNIININRDDVRYRNTHWTEYQHTRENEEFVTVECDAAWEEARYHDLDVIISDTNLNHYTRNKWVNRAVEAGYRIIYVIFKVNEKVLLERNSKRERQLSVDIIKKQLYWLDGAITDIEVLVSMGYGNSIVQYV